MEVNFTDRIKVRRPENIRESSFKRRLEAFEIEVSFDTENISLVAEKPLTEDEWQEILKKNLR